MSLQVSVIIPVYNAERYVEQAVESALAQPETGEVILIEDASPDGALAVCENLAAMHTVVRLLRHADGRNHGAGASRNLGVDAAKYEYIAFLDADDVFLPDRFAVDVPMLESDSTLDGVYHTVGRLLETEKYRERFSEVDQQLIRISEEVTSDRLFEALVTREYGFFHTLGITVRRDFFQRCGGFDTRLRKGQDTALWIVMAHEGKLVPGTIDQPVALYRHHENNRVDPGGKVDPETRVKRYASLLQWAASNGLRRDRSRLLLEEYSRFYFKARLGGSRGLGRRLGMVRVAASLLRVSPRLAMRSVWWGYLLRAMGLGRLVPSASTVSSTNAS